MSCTKIILWINCVTKLFMNIYDACTNANVSCNSLCMCMVVFQFPTPIPEILSLELMIQLWGYIDYDNEWLLPAVHDELLNRILHNSKYNAQISLSNIYNYKYSHIYSVCIKPRILHDYDYNGILITSTWSRSGVPHCGARLVDMRSLPGQNATIIPNLTTDSSALWFLSFAALEDLIWLAEFMFRVGSMCFHASFSGMHHGLQQLRHGSLTFNHSDST